MLSEVVEVLAKSSVEALAKLKVAALIVSASAEASPKVVVPFTLSAWFKVVVPVAAPREIVVPAPAKFTVVAVEFKRLKVVAVVVKSPPFTAKSPAKVVSAPERVIAVAVEERISLPVICKSSAITVLVPVASIFKLPEASVLSVV